MRNFDGSVEEKDPDCLLLLLLLPLLMPYEWHPLALGFLALRQLLNFFFNFKGREKKIKVLDWRERRKIKKKRKKRNKKEKETKIFENIYLPLALCT